MSKKKILIYIGGLVTLFVILGTTTFGINTVLEGFKVLNGALYIPVNSNGVCKSITNNSANNDLFIPTKTLTEWNLFQLFKPSYVVLNECGMIATSNGVITYVDSNGLNPRTSPAWHNGYTMHKFTNVGSSNTFTVTDGGGIIEYTIVAGGGGGGNPEGGGGGAGGVLIGSTTASVVGSPYTITVGVGGVQNTSGSNSSAFSLTAIGGGSGGRYPNVTGLLGGSGGGNSGGGPAGAGTAGQGNSGSSVQGYSDTGGGGGGAGAPGSSFTGGNGRASFDGITYGGGGGGGNGQSQGYYGAGGTGGGGSGGYNGAGGSGTNGLGGGGGGGGNNGSTNFAGGSGGSGSVIIRYQNSPKVPDAPTSVTAIAGNATATISFVPPVNWGGTPIINYKVTAVEDSSKTITGSGSPLIVTGLTNGTSYTFTVTATNDGGTSTPSVASSAVIPKTIPSAPTIGVATAGNAQATVAFTPNSNGGSAIINYKVTAVEDSSKTITGASSPLIVTGLTNGTSYTFTVTATNIVGTSTASAVSSAVTPRTIPGAPTVTGAVPGNLSATVIFTAPASNGGSAITNYTVTSSPGGVSSSSSASPITVTGLANGTSYTFTVTATNAAGTGPASAPSNPAVVPSSFVVLGGNITYTDSSGLGSYSTPQLNGYTVHTFNTVGTSSLTFSGPSFISDVLVVAGGGGGASSGGGGGGGGLIYRPGFIINGNQSVTVGAGGAGGYNYAGGLVGGDSIFGTLTAKGGGHGDTYYGTPQTDGGSGGGGGYTAGPGGVATQPSQSGDSGIYGYGYSGGNGNNPGNYPGGGGGGAGSAGTGAPSTAMPGNGGNGKSVSISGAAVYYSAGAGGAPQGSDGNLGANGTGYSGYGSGGASVNSNYGNLYGQNGYAGVVIVRHLTVLTAPGTPTGVTATAGNSSANISFTAPTNIGGTPITNYTVTSSGGQTASSSTSPITVTGLTNGTTYTFTITASNAIGTSSPSAATSPAITPAYQVPQNGLVGYWSFNESSGTALDSTVYTNNGTLVGAATRASGVLGNAISLNGSGSYVNAGNNAILNYGTSDFSAAAWIKTSSCGNYPYIIGKENGYGSYGWNMVIEPGSGKLRIQIHDGGGTYTFPSSPNICNGAWHHVAATWQRNGNATGYVDGVSVGTFGISGYVNINLTNSISLWIGKQANGNDFNGLIDEPAVYNRVLTAPEISAMYLGTASVPGAPTIGTGTAGNMSATIFFTAPTFNGGIPISSYKVTSSGGQTTSSSTSPITVTGLTNNTAYTFTVVAINAKGTSTASGSVGVTPLPPVAPGAPTSVSATPGNGQAFISFTAPAFDGRSPITSYTVTSSGGQTASSSTSPITVTGLTNGTSYTFTVTATNAAGTSVASSPSTGVTPSVQTITGGAITYTDSFGLNPRSSPAYPGGYTVHTFTTSGQLSVSGTPINAQVLVVAGGGGTGYSQYHNGGGGGGGVVYNSLKNLPVGTYTATVGNGGTGGTATYSLPGDGQPSVFWDITALGGGYGGIYNNTPGHAGGSGGGGAENGNGASNVYGAATQGSSGGGTGYGYSGGTGGYGGPGAGGGGGAGQAGQAGTGTHGGNGGNGIAFSISGTNTYYGGGGGGAGYYKSAFSIGGLGGGGFGGYALSGGAGSNGVAGYANGIANTGGGAGGYERSDVRTGGIGGSGVVIVRHVSVLSTSSAPIIGTATAGNGQATVTFTPPINDGGSSISSYTVVSNPGATTTVGFSSPIIVPGLINGTSYTFKAYATNGTGMSSSSAASNSVTPVAAYQVPQTGLIGYWKFDAGSGTSAIDSSTNGITGTFSGSPIWVTGKKGTALDFNGSSYITLGTNALLNIQTSSFTISGWMKSSSTFANGGFISTGANDTGTGLILSSTSGINVNKAGVLDQWKAYTFTPGTWYYITAVQNFSGSTPTNVEYYINGVSIGTFANSSTFTSPVGQEKRIGHAYSWGYFKGTIDEVTVYNRALSPAEISAMYTGLGGL